MIQSTHNTHLDHGGEEEGGQTGVKALSSGQCDAAVIFKEAWTTMQVRFR